MMVYMANCGGSCTSANPASLDWFKIDGGGVLSGTVANGEWASGQMIAQNSSWTSTIPASLPNGEYMIRHETLALHARYQPQFYMQCAQLTITGGGSGSPGPTVKFPGGYSASDPSINIDVYASTATTYTYEISFISEDYTALMTSQCRVPGPAVWHG
jgi:hypothetical protein